VVLVDASETPCELSPELRLRAEGAGVEVVVLQAAPSTAGQRNRGVEAVESPLVLLLDDDIVVPPEYAGLLLERWEAAGLDALGAVVGSTAPVRGGRVGTWLRRLLLLHVDDPGGAATRLRRSGKVSYVDRPPAETEIPVVGAGAVLYRTDLARRHPFDERFPGYALGEDLEMSSRVAREAPILQLPEPEYVHEFDSGGRDSPERWHIRGRRETYFRLRRLDRSPLTMAAFGVSVLGELAAAVGASVRERSVRSATGYAQGVWATLREERRGRHSRGPAREASGGVAGEPD
jgi:GT2 family glycosyltransferase